MKPKVLIVPKDTNPYQELLYKKIRENNIVCDYFENEFINKHAFVFGIPALPFRLMFNRLKGYNVMHLHWLYSFVFPLKGFVGKFMSTFYFLYFMFLVKVLNYKLIYTAHNITPHEPQFLDDNLIYSMIYKFSDQIIVHSEENLKQIKDVGFSIKNIQVIPSGNYNSIYQNDISQKEAREKLALPQNSKVFVFFGAIKQYKGLETLIEVFNRLQEEHKNIYLIIAGKIWDQELWNNLSGKLTSNIKSYTNYIPDDELQVYINAADAVVLPFTRITNSSSALLALSFEKLLVAPRIGSLKDLPEFTGIFYSADDAARNLEQSLKTIITSDKIEVSIEKLRIYNASLTWENVAKRTIDLYNSCFK